MPDSGEIKARVVVEYDGSGVQKAKEDLASLADISGNLEEGAGGAADGLATLDEQMGKNADSAKSFNEAIAGLPKMMESGEASVSSFNDALSAQQGTIDDTAQSLSNIQEPLKSYNESMQAVSDTMSGPHLTENLSAFQDALENPYPFQMIGQYLNETGQSWGDFTGTIGENNTAMLHEMATNADVTHEVLGGMGADAQAMNKTFTESAGSAAAFTEQFNGIGAAATDASKAVAETGSVVEEAGSSMRSVGGLGEALSSTMSGMSDFFGGAGLGAMMAAQMIIPMVTQAAQGIYNMAAVAEGPAAHSFGTFTGTVDALGQSMQVVGGQFSESFGRQVIPTLNAVNYQMAQSAGTAQDLGGNLGGISSFLVNWGQTIEGPALMMNPLTFGAGLAMTQAGFEGMINQGASAFGLQQPFQGPGVTSQNPMAQQIAQLNAAANDPQYLAAQASYQSAYSKAAQAQQAYDVSHYGGTTGPDDPMNAIIQAELINAGGGVYGQSAYSGGCFPAGTKVLLANGDEKPIETLQVGEEVLAHDGTTQRSTTVLALIKPPLKRVYELVFSDGNTLTTTDSHPIATPLQGWKALSVEHAKQENPDLEVTTLQVGDTISTADGTATLVSIQPREVVQVYNIEVGEPHTFYANKVLVHNKMLGGMANNGVGTEQTTVNHTFTANVTWEANNLEKQFTAAAQWAEQNLVHTAIAAAQWAEQNLIHTATAAAQWVEQGLVHEATAAAEWAEQNLIHPAIAAAQWTEQGLVHDATAVANWAEQGLEHLFTGKASWIGQDLEHLFTGVAQWTAQNLNPTFTVNPSVTMLAEGASNFAGGPAIVGEAGTEVVEHNGQYSLFNQGASLVNLPSGANVYPMKDLMSGSSPSQFADGTGDQTIPITLGMSGRGGGMPESISVVVQIDSQAVLSAIGMPMAQNIRVTGGMRGY